MAPNQDLISELITEARADEVGLWLIIAKLRDECGIIDSRRLRAATLDFVREFLDSGDVVAGHYSGDGRGIIVWNMPISDVVRQISEKWDALGREPNIGDIVVFIGRPSA